MNRYIQPLRNFHRLSRLRSQELGSAWPEQNSKNAELRIRDYLEKERKRLQEAKARLVEQEKNLKEIEQDFTGTRTIMKEQNTVERANLRYFEAKAFHPEERHLVRI